jgi:predicted transcriptional regulator
MRSNDVGAGPKIMTTEDQMIANSLVALEEYRRTGHAIAQEEVQAWVDSLGTDDELPCPQ